MRLEFDAYRGDSSRNGTMNITVKAKKAWNAMGKRQDTWFCRTK